MPRHTSLLTSVFAGLLAAAGPAAAQVMILGNPDSHSCYVAAQTGVQPVRGIEACDAALKNDNMTARDRAATRVNRGVLYDMVDRYPEAWADFNAGLAISPDLGDGYLNRGAALIRLNRFSEAQADLQKALALGVPMPQVGYYDLAIAEEKLGLVTDAYHDYRQALEQDPNFAPAAEALKRFSVISAPSGTGSDG
jgi:tetratricopeptide (TPR) repeat protein